MYPTDNPQGTLYDIKSLKMLDFKEEMNISLLEFNINKTTYLNLWFLKRKFKN